MLLTTGGIGIRLRAAMTATLSGSGQLAQMLFPGRDHISLVHTELLRSLLECGLRLHTDEEANRSPDIAFVIEVALLETDFYVCGLQSMLDGVLISAQHRGMAPQRIHFGMYSPPAGPPSIRPFEVILARSGRTLRVESDQSLLGLLNQDGCDVLHDFGREECGMCRVAVVESSIDGRNYSPSEWGRGEGHVMQACVSRNLDSRLVLDL